MTLNQTTMERLVFVKSLHQEGIEQSEKQMPMASISVLTFHDAVELFLYLSAEHVDAHPSSKIMQYWNDIKQKSGIEISSRSGIDRLRQARVGLKHYGNRPDEREIKSFRSTVQSFFEENTPKVFDIEYSEIDLAQLVRFEDAQNHLFRADEFWEKNEKASAMGDLRLAHKTMMVEHRDRARLELEYEPYPQFTPGTNSEYREIERIERALEQVSEAIMYISMGVDYRDYRRFQSLTPRLVANTDSENIYEKYRPHIERYDENDIEDKHYVYCKNFVIELALMLQNMDFDFEKDIDNMANSAFDW